MVKCEKKQIKDMTHIERLCICNEHIYDKCVGCPFLLDVKGAELHYCVHHILNVLEREVEIKYGKDNSK